MATDFETEAIFAQIGLEAILAARPRLTKYRLTDAADLPKEMRRRLVAFLSGNDFTEAREMPKFDYRKVLDQVTAEDAGQTPEQSQALFAAIPDKELAHDLALLANRICTQANTLIPREPPNPVTNQPDYDPEPAATADFQRFWDVACDPMAVLGDLEDGSLIDDQVGTVSLLFPAIYAELRQAASDAISTLVARNGTTWEPTPTKAALLATLKQQDMFDAELAATVQSSYAAQAQAEAAASPAPPKQAPRQGEKTTEATPGQDAQAG